MKYTILHKALAYTAALGNVGAAVLVLDPSSALHLLGSFSLIQMLIPFAGLGLAQRLARTPADMELVVHPLPFYLSLLLGVVLLLGQGLVIQAPYRNSIVGMGIALHFATTIAEHFRADASDQSGFVVVNASILFAAAAIVWRGSVDSIAVSIAAIAFVINLAGFIRRGRFHFGVRHGMAHATPTGVDVVKALRILVVNQYYNVVAFLLSVLSPSESSLALLVVYRSNIVLNWQTFYWMRLAHKATLAGVTPDALRQNRRMLSLNLLGVVAVGIFALVWFTFDLVEVVTLAGVDDRTVLLLVTYAGLVSLENLMFPYEVFNLYTASVRRDVMFLCVATISLLVLGFMVAAAVGSLVILVGAELVWMTWRMSCRDRGERIFALPTWRE